MSDDTSVTTGAAHAPQLSEAGRALDAEIARRVFGYFDVGEFEGQLVHGEYNMNGWPMPTPHYSTDIAAAWTVVEAMQARDLRVVLDSPLGGWECMTELDNWFHVERADTAPLAICLAALQAVDVSRASATPPAPPPAVPEDPR